MGYTFHTSASLPMLNIHTYCDSSGESQTKLAFDILNMYDMRDLRKFVDHLVDPIKGSHEHFEGDVDVMFVSGIIIQH